MMRTSREAAAVPPAQLSTRATDRRLHLVRSPTSPTVIRPIRGLAVVVGCNIARWRRRRGLTQAALAEAVECSNSAITRWESGERLPSLPHLLAVSRALGCPPAALLTAATGCPPPPRSGLEG